MIPVGKLGLKPARHDARTLHMARYLTNDLQPPPRRHWSDRVTSLGPMLNDRIGCCTIAAFGHLVQTWTANAGQQVIVPDVAVETAYEQACGYDPNDPSTDEGGVLLDVLRYMRKTGIGGHKIGAFAALEPQNKTHIELGVDMFGGVVLGVGLPLSAQGEEVWSVPVVGPVGPGKPRSWGGHAIPVVDYGPIGLVCISWGQLITMTWRFFETYVEEAFTVLAPDWCDGTQTAPSGFALEQLQTDLLIIGA